MILQGTTETTTSEHVIEYIGGMTSGLARMAKGAGLEALAYILGMASLECDQVTSVRTKEGPTRRARARSADRAAPASKTHG